MGAKQSVIEPIARSSVINQSIVDMALAQSLQPDTTFSQPTIVEFNFLSNKECHACVQIVHEFPIADSDARGTSTERWHYMILPDKASPKNEAGVRSEWVAIRLQDPESIKRRSRSNSLTGSLKPQAIDAY